MSRIYSPLLAHRSARDELRKIQCSDIIRRRNVQLHKLRANRRACVELPAFAVVEFGSYISLMRRDEWRAGGTIKVCNLWLSLGGIGPHTNVSSVRTRAYIHTYICARGRGIARTCKPLAQESPKMEGNYRIFGL